MGDIQVVELRGGPRQRGRQHGETLRRAIVDLHDSFRAMMLSAEGDEGKPSPVVTDAVMRAYARQHEPHIREQAPGLHEEMTGIAEGANVPFDTILVLTCVAEIRRLKMPAVHASLAATIAEGQRGCTCFGVQGGAAEARAVYIGQTYDIEPLWTPIAFRILPGDGEPDQLVIGHAGIMAEFGLNAAGIGFVASAILVTDQRPGLPAPVIARMILRQRRLGDAAGAAIDATRTVGIHYLIAAAFGMIDLETSATRHAIAYVQDDVHAFANHIRSPDLLPLSLGVYGQSTFVREGRMHQLLAAGGHRIGVPYLQDCLRDHADHPMSICGHVAEGVSTCESRCAVVLKPAEAAMWVTDGTPCAHPFQELKLAPTSARGDTPLRVVS